MIERVMNYAVLQTKTDGTKVMTTCEFVSEDLVDALRAVDDPACAYVMLFRPGQLDGYITRVEGETTAVATLLKCKPTEIADRVERLFAKMAEHDVAIKELKAKLKERP